MILYDLFENKEKGQDVDVKFTRTIIAKINGKIEIKKMKIDKSDEE